MRVKALQKTYYNRRDRQIGEIYEMDDREHSEARVLSILGKIQILANEAATPAAKPATYRAAALKAEEPQQTQAKPMTTENTDPLVPRRYYRRRDMKAEQ